MGETPERGARLGRWLGETDPVPGERSMAASNQHPEVAQPGDGVDISARRARGAFPGKHVLLILAASLALVIIAFLVAFATNPTTPLAGKPGSAQVTDPATVQRFDTQATPPKSSSPN
jgi:hypothetical protein